MPDRSLSNTDREHGRREKILLQTVCYLDGRLIYSAEIVGLFKQEKQVADSRTYSCSKMNKKMTGLSTNCETIII